MIKLLSQPYPSVEASGRQWIKAAYIGGFVGLFLLVFQPFGMDEWDTPVKALKLLGFGIIAFLVTGLNFTVWSRLFPRSFSDDRWTVGRAILLILANILSIAIVNRLYLAWLTGEGVSLTSWLNMILITFLIGIFPSAGSVVANYIVQLRKYTRSVADLPPHVPTTTLVNERPLTLTAENEKETLQLPSSDLFFIESSDNYCTVVYRRNGQSDKVLLRSSLSRLEGQIQRSTIVRCHRSYVVNLDQVERVTGNAQGYKLHLAEGRFMVPVARQYNDSLVAQLKS
ncbi:MAG: LytTR family transcriptional regulator [Bacteroidetes bacterium]|nr:LytTR family transcriptional regulator [Fibrella sp.]